MVLSFTWTIFILALQVERKIFERVRRTWRTARDQESANVPLNIPGFLQRGTETGDALQKPCRDVSTAPESLRTGLNDHANHASCNPCTSICPHCQGRVIIAGFEFHLKACKPLQQARTEVTNPARGMHRSVQHQYPAAHHALTQAAQTEDGQRTSQRRRRSTRRYQAAKNGKADAAVLPLNVPSFLTKRVEEISAPFNKARTRSQRLSQGRFHSGSGKGGVFSLAGVPSNKLALPVPLDDHARHEACNPCALKCPHCGKNVLLAGYVFHVRECVAVQAEHGRVTSIVRTMPEALRHQYPGGTAALDKYRREHPEDSLMVRNRRREMRAALLQDLHVELREVVGGKGKLHLIRDSDAAMSKASSRHSIAANHDDHFTCYLRKTGPCTIMCLYCANAVLVSGYLRHQAECGKKFMKMMKEGGEHEADRQEAIEMYNKNAVFEAFDNVAPFKHENQARSSNTGLGATSDTKEDNIADTHTDNAQNPSAAGRDAGSTPAVSRKLELDLNKLPDKFSSWGPISRAKTKTKRPSSNSHTFRLR